MPRHLAAKILPAHCVKNRFIKGDRAGGAGQAVNHRQFAKNIPRLAKQNDRRFAAIQPVDENTDLSRLNEVERMTGVALVEDDVSLLVIARHNVLSDGLELPVGYIGKKRCFFEELDLVCCFHGLAA